MIPVVDLRDPDAPARIDAACREVGFFTLTGHGIDAARRAELLDVAARFFALSDTTKAEVAMVDAGAAWRGWFPLGGELTSGVPDRKEGFYAGREQRADGRPLHGPNQWPAEPATFADVVTRWMGDMEAIGQQVLSRMAVGLGQPADLFAGNLTADPTALFRIFRYPPHPAGDTATWGVGEHTDYGLLTLLVHDGTPGLEVRVGDAWQPVDPDPDLIVCNLGDMLDRLTDGRYHSTSHRVRNLATHDRWSFPFFLDPGWDAVIEPMALDDGWVRPDDATRRWDLADLRHVSGRYGDWLTAKVSRVFPDLAAQHLHDGNLTG